MILCSLLSVNNILSHPPILPDLSEASSGLEGDVAGDLMASNHLQHRLLTLSLPQINQGGLGDGIKYYLQIVKNRVSYYEPELWCQKSLGKATHVTTRYLVDAEFHA